MEHLKQWGLSQIYVFCSFSKAESFIHFRTKLRFAKLQPDWRLNDFKMGV
jgi:hypothetical protein